MSEQAREQVNFRANRELIDVLDELRRLHKPVAKISDVIRDAILEKARRDLPPSKKASR